LHYFVHVRWCAFLYVWKFNFKKLGAIKD
jgi:hypothetical protein